MYRAAILSLGLVLMGCASSPTITLASRSKSNFTGAAYPGQLTVIDEDKSGREQYRVFEKGASSFVSLEAIRESAEQRADAYCDKQGLFAKTLTAHTSKPPHILGNFPRVELVFVCVPKETSVVSQPAFQDEKYIRLTNLKKLLDDGVISKEEFEREKAKILSEQSETTPPN